jgi:hypothetical protein
MAFARVSEGAIGTITSADRVIDGADVKVEWGGPGRRTLWVDWLTTAGVRGAHRGNAIARRLEAPDRAFSGGVNLLGLMPRMKAVLPDRQPPALNIHTDTQATHTLRAWAYWQVHRSTVRRSPSPR